jgi:hypothetical protein
LGSDLHQRVKEIFMAACERPPGERTAFLKEACANDVELLREIESLLQFHDDRDVDPAQATPPGRGDDRPQTLPETVALGPDGVLHDRIADYRFLQKVGESRQGWTRSRSSPGSNPSDRLWP